MAQEIWSLYKALGREEFKVLRAVESLLGRYEYVPLELIERRLNMPPSRISKALKTLSNYKLIRRRLGGVSGYTLTFRALDLLALDNLVGRGVVSEVGSRIGRGKEGEVYVALSPGGERVIIKFHREGTRSFKKVARHRSYTLDYSIVNWLILAKTVGEREFKALASLSREGARVPEPIAWNRHAVVQEYISGVELSERPELGDIALDVLRDIVETLRIAYTKVGIVHGDLSEYNVLVSDEGRGYVIDWPQYVYREEPHAEELLLRDVTYIARFFRRVYGVEASVERLLRYVRGEEGEPW